MNKSKLLFQTALACVLFNIEAPAADIAVDTARIQAMDKITGKVSEIDIPVNGLTNFGTFSILVRKCVTRSAEETPENTAFIDIVDNYQTENPVNIFKGWMFSSTPALNAVEHPIYDVWLLKCYDAKTGGYKTLSEEQLALRDTLPMSRPQKIDISTSMKPEDETESADSQTEAKQAENSTDGIVNLDIKNIANTEGIKEEADEDFISEDEQPAEVEINQPETDILSPETKISEEAVTSEEIETDENI